MTLQEAEEDAQEPLTPTQEFVKALDPALIAEEDTPDCVFALSPIQARAMDLLLTGQTLLHVAEVLGISRRTLTRWKTVHPEFVAEYNRRISAQADVTAARLRHIIDLATARVETVLSSGPGPAQTACSLRVLSSQVPRSLPHRKGLTDVNLVVNELIKDRIRSFNEDPEKPYDRHFKTEFITSLDQFFAQQEVHDRELESQDHHSSLQDQSPGVDTILRQQDQPDQSPERHRETHRQTQDARGHVQPSPTPPDQTSAPSQNTTTSTTVAKILASQPPPAFGNPMQSP